VKNESAIYIYLLVYYCLKLQATQASLLINENLFFLEYAGELRIFVSREESMKNQTQQSEITHFPFFTYCRTTYQIVKMQ